MATLVHSPAVRNAQCTALTTQLESGSTNPTARLRILDASDTLLVEIVLSSPAFSSPSGGTITLQTAQVAFPVANGTAAEAVFVNKSATEVLRVDVTDNTGTGGFFSVPTTTITTGLPFALSGSPFTYSAPA